jgi:hypothetical protein
MADVVIAFSSEVDTGSREENASKQEPGASVLIQSEPIMLWRLEHANIKLRADGHAFNDASRG